MKWKKLGRIFNPVEHELPNNCNEFAQSPQALGFDDFVRIYFSTRAKDKTGKFLSHIAYVDFDKQFKEILNISKKTVIELGELGCYDEHGIFPLNIVRANVEGLGGTIHFTSKENEGSTFVIRLPKNRVIFSINSKKPPKTTTRDKRNRRF